MTVDQNRDLDLDVSICDESFVNPTLKTFGSEITCLVSTCEPFILIGRIHHFEHLDFADFEILRREDASALQVPIRPKDFHTDSVRSLQDSVKHQDVVFIFITSFYSPCRWPPLPLHSPSSPLPSLHLPAPPIQAQACLRDLRGLSASKPTP